MPGAHRALAVHACNLGINVTASRTLLCLVNSHSLPRLLPFSLFRADCYLALGWV
jgi:hypothetical protein